MKRTFAALPLAFVLSAALAFTGLFGCTAASADGLGDPHKHALKHYEAVTPACETDGNVEYWYCDGCGKYFADEEAATEINVAESPVVLPATGHDWDSPVWKWTEDREAYVSFTCLNDPAHSQSIAAEVVKDAPDPDCEKDQLIVYTASAELDGEVYTDETTEDLPHTGHSLDSVDELEPDCTTEGNVAYWQCLNCGKAFSDAAGTVPIEDVTIPAKGHDLLHMDAVDPDCETDGSVEYWSCVVCERMFSDAAGGTEIADATVPALGHELTHVAEEAPGCETDGQVEHWLCDRCGKVFADAEATTELSTVTLAAKGHVLTHVDAVAAGCETTGNPEHWSCAVCGKTFSDSAGTAELSDVTVAATGHTWGGWTVVTPAGCETAGTEQRVCAKDASHVETRSVAATGHTWGDWTVVTPAGCETTGTEQRVCTKDASHVETRSVAATGHTWGDWTVVTPSGCETTGTERRVCTKDTSHVETRTVAATGHTWGGWTTVTAAGCEAAGTEQRVCAKDASHVETRSVAATGHAWGSWVVTTEPGCKTKGESIRTCRNDPGHTEAKTIAITGHDWGAWEVVTEASCEEGGLERRACKHDPSHVQTRAIPAAGHSFSAEWHGDDHGHWRVCTVCGAEGELAGHQLGPASQEGATVCTICGYEQNTAMTISSDALFRSTGDMNLQDLTFVKEAESDTFTVELPAEEPASNGYYFEGWRSSDDGQLHEPGSSFTFRYAETRSVTFEGEWTQIIGIGTYDLNAGKRYRFASGSFRVAGDDTVYGGDQYFYLPADGTYSIGGGA